MDRLLTKKRKQFIKRLFVLSIVGLILYQIHGIGWGEVLRSLPTQPLFYVLFVVLFFTLPVAEIIIYKQIWNFKAFEGFKAFITKKVYNEEVMGYSGEAYLFVWGRRQNNKSETDLLKDIRDNNIISAFTSYLVAILLIVALIMTGQIEPSQFIGRVNLLYVAVGVILTAAAVYLLRRFKDYLFDLPLNKTLTIFSIYLGRFLIHHGLLIVQWAIVIPFTPLSVWFTFLAIIIVVNRIPFVPSKDLIFMWAGIELSMTLEMATAEVAGMLLVSSALVKLTNLFLYLIINYYAPVEISEEAKSAT